MDVENENTSETASEDVSKMDKAKHMMNDTMDKTRKAVGDQLGQAKEKLSQVAEKVNDQIGDDVSERFSEAQARAKEAAREQYAVRSEQFKEGYSKVQDNMGHVSDDLGTFVKQNPGRAVLIAAAAGFLIGLLFRGRGE